jgi:hypothetical protein
MIEYTIGDKISHENILIDDLKKIEESSASLECMANDEQIINGTQKIILDELSTTSNILMRYQERIHYANYKHFQDFLKFSFNMNSLIRSKLEDFQSKLKIVNWLSEKLKLLVKKSFNSIMSKSPCENIEIQNVPDNSEICKDFQPTINKSRDTTFYENFFHIACEIFSTRKRVGIIIIN